MKFFKKESQVANSQSEFEFFKNEYRLEELTKEDLEKAYQVVAARKLNFENLLWQIPLLSLTGESFLFTIILGNSSNESRIISAFLAMVLAIASLSSLSRHRISDVHDSQLVAAIEMKLFNQTFHGKQFRDSRNAFTSAAYPFRKNDFWDWTVKLMSHGRAYPVWISVFLILFLTAAFCLTVSLIDPNFFNN